MVKQSLAAQTGALAEKFQLPAVFSAPPEKVKARYIAPYVTFAHPKRADEWAKIVSQTGNAAEGDMYLIRQQGIVSLSPMRCSLLHAKQYWAEANPVGDMVRVSYKEMPRPYKEHVEAVVLVYLPDEVVPANIRFKTTKCGAAKALSDALHDASEPSWADKSPAHKETLICTQPWMRFVGDVTVAPPRTGKGSGMPYRPAQCNVKPTSVVEWRLLKKFCDDEGSQKLLEDAAARYNSQLEEIAKKAV